MNAARKLTIGGTLTVNRTGFGAMRLCGKHVWGWPEDRENALRVLRRAVELGVDFIDTADSYGPYISEELIAEALHPYPEGLVIATKGGLRRTGPGEWPRDARPERLKEGCEGSLRRLRLDRIDLYQLHAPDPQVPLEDSLGALKELQDEGKIRHTGVANFDAQQMRRAINVAPITSLQPQYSLLATDVESSILPFALKHRIGVIVYSPMASGLLSGAMTRERIAALPEDDWRKRSANFQEPARRIRHARAEVQQGSNS